MRLFKSLHRRSGATDPFPFVVWDPISGLHWEETRDRSCRLCNPILGEWLEEEGQGISEGQGELVEGVEMSDGMNSKTMGIGSCIETGRITEGGSSNHLNGGTER